METAAVAKPERVWKSNQILISAIIGGFLAGGYLVNQNYKAMGQPELAKKVLITTILSSLALFLSLLLISEEAAVRFSFFMVLAQCIMTVGYLFGLHYKIVEGISYDKQLWIALPLISLLILAIPFYFYEFLTFEIPAFIGVSMPAWSLQFLAQYLQEGKVKELMDGGVKKGKFLRLLGISISSLLIHLTAIAAVTLFYCCIY